MSQIRQQLQLILLVSQLALSISCYADQSRPVPRISETEIEIDSTATKINIDDKRPEDQFTTQIFDRPLTIGGEYEIRSEYEKNFNLDSDDREDQTFIDQSFTLEFFYELSDKVSLFFDGTAFYSQGVQAQDAKLRSFDAIERGQTWLLFESLFESNFDFQIGSQFFSDDREWWWDDVLDGLSIQYENDYLYAEIAFAGIFARTSTNDDRIDPEEKDVTFILSQIEWEWSRKNSLGLFFLYQDDHSNTEQSGDLINEDKEDDTDADLYWLGFRSNGRIKTSNAGRFYYWLDTGVVRGIETVIDFDDDAPDLRIADEVDERDVHGWAIDTGVTWQTKLAMQPSFSFGFAMGSGDAEPDSEDDKAFRQTGLEGNNGRFRGVNRFKYYGELLDPELSNLKIWTLAAGLNFSKNSSVEILYHKYQQVRPVSFLRNVRLDDDPSGNDTDIGQEIDVIIGLEEWKHFEVELIAAVFKPGDAFSKSTDLSSNIILKMDYNF